MFEKRMVKMIFCVVEFYGIGKGFGVDDVLKNIDFMICLGEFLFLVGMLGCGKFMLFCIIVGLE